MSHAIIDKLATKQYVTNSELLRVSANTKSSYGYIVSYDDPLFTVDKDIIRIMAGHSVECPLPSNITDSTIMALLRRISTYSNTESTSLIEGIHQVAQHRLKVNTIIGPEKTIEKIRYLVEDCIFIYTDLTEDTALYVVDKNNFNLVYIKNNEEYLYFYRTCHSVARVVL